MKKVRPSTAVPVRPLKHRLSPKEQAERALKRARRASRPRVEPTPEKLAAEMRNHFKGPARYLRYGSHALDVIADQILDEWAARVEALGKKSVEHEPGEIIANVACPCCGAELEVTHGDDEGEIAIMGTAHPPKQRGPSRK